jgi:hypothetical protein
MNTFVSVVKRVRKPIALLILVGAICLTITTQVRAESGVGTAIKMIIDAFSFSTTKTPIDSNGCYEGSYVTDETRKPPVPICISEDGRVKDNPGPPPNKSDNESLNSSGLNLAPSGPQSAVCSNAAEAAVRKVLSNSFLMETYRSASAQTGTPWEVLAAIHHLEANNNPNGSLISGRPFGVYEKDQGRTYNNLLETAIDAAQIFKGKKAIVLDVIRKNPGMKQPTEYEMLVGQFASYNSPTQSECAMVQNVDGEYIFTYTGKTWSGIPDRGQCKGAGSEHAKGEKYVGERHVYATGCLDTDHENMYFHFHNGGDTKPLDRIGAITFIKALQRLSPSESNVPVPTGQTSRPPISGSLVYYPQCNGTQHTGSWANQLMVNSAEQPIGCTYCKASCGLAAGAMIVSSYLNPNVDPPTFLKKYNSNQNMTCEGASLTSIGTTLSQYGITVGNHIAIGGKSLSDLILISKARNYLDNGWTLLTLGSINGYGHYVWIVGIDSQNRFLIYDPYWGKNSPLPFNSKNYLTAQVSYITPVKKTGTIK